LAKWLRKELYYVKKNERKVEIIGFFLKSLNIISETCYHKTEKTKEVYVYDNRF